LALGSEGNSDPCVCRITRMISTMCLQESYRHLDQRRHQDLEGFTADITLLRQKLFAIERKLHQQRLMGRLEHDERLDTLLGYLQKKAPSVPCSAATSVSGSIR
jgi:hypothetical protein